MQELGIIIASTRPNRVGASIASWFVDKVKQHGKLEPIVVDLKEIALPAMDEPNHPLKKNYQHEHTKSFSRLIAPLDAFAIILPEYNYGMPPALLNALDYLFFEWQCKPVSFVSYGGVSGGLRSAQMSKLVLTSLKMMPLPEAVSIPFAQKLVDAEGRFNPGNTQDEAVVRMLDELSRWAEALKPLRPAL